MDTVSNHGNIVFSKFDMSAAQLHHWSHAKKPKEIQPTLTQKSESLLWKEQVDQLDPSGILGDWWNFWAFYNPIIVLANS